MHVEEHDVPEGKLHYSEINDPFILSTSLLSLILSGLYAVRIVTEGFDWKQLVLAIYNFLYIPYIMIFKKKSFAWYYLVYAVILVFIQAFTMTALYNNFSALFVVCIVIMINPKLKLTAIIAYSVAACAAFILNDEDLIHFLMHAARSAWFIIIVTYVFANKYERKSLILYEDEKDILEQLCHGAIYQKEVQGYSENTVYRKLKAARERNGNVTRDELIEMYRNSK